MCSNKKDLPTTSTIYTTTKCLGSSLNDVVDYVVDYIAIREVSVYMLVKVTFYTLKAVHSRLTISLDGLCFQYVCLILTAQRVYAQTTNIIDSFRILNSHKIDI